MRIPRIYHPESLTVGTQVALCEDAANHVGRVLRMGKGQAIQLFDGSNHVFEAVITDAGKKNVTVEIQSSALDDRESPIHIHLGQVMSRGDKMEFTIQKSIELGVSLITPLFSERCGKKSRLPPVSSAVATRFPKFARRWTSRRGAPSRMMR